ncbi:hypothetical protein PPSIR1_31778 [Plesiocystis pacifica SIR-1]|uniref:Lipoprotein n=1 Tax=Plesiocystis pacifica SIR-1 TaxID=391625 RepID=A6G2S3_9BACT|nr:hypothetical protein [Plesiocystis pacifica]EDM79773.1 hypothetical protein PPSIR1_31778 [Plesiocystis pacifica SIR-1]
MMRLRIALLPLALLLAAACTGKEDTSSHEPAAPKAEAASESPEKAPAEEAPAASADDVRYLRAMAEACFEEGAAIPESPATLTPGPGEGARWIAEYATADGKEYRFELDPAAGTCNGEALTVEKPAASIGASEAVKLCWEAAQAKGGKGMMGSALVNEARLYVGAGSVGVSFPEENMNGAPAGLDMAVNVGTKVCTVDVMD